MLQSKVQDEYTRNQQTTTDSEKRTSSALLFKWKIRTLCIAVNLSNAPTLQANIDISRYKRLFDQTTTTHTSNLPWVNVAFSISRKRKLNVGGRSRAVLQHVELANAYS